MSQGDFGSRQRRVRLRRRGARRCCHKNPERFEEILLPNGGDVGKGRRQHARQKYDAVNILDGEDLKHHGASAVHIAFAQCGHNGHETLGQLTLARRAFSPVGVARRPGGERSRREHLVGVVTLTDVGPGGAK